MTDDQKRDIARRITGRQFDPDSDAPTADVEGFFNPTEDVDVVFDDGFASSYSKVSTDEPDNVKTSIARFILYNDHIPDTCNEMVEIAVSLGCPQTGFHEAVGLKTVSDDILQKALAGVSRRLDGFEEGSLIWLALQTYFHWARAATCLHTNAPNAIYAEAMMLAGASAREYELSARNKTDALERKKQVYSLIHRNQGRDQHNILRRQKAKEWRAHAEEIIESLQQKGSKSSIANSILARWNKFGETGCRPAPPAKKTLQNWLSKR